MEAKDVLAEVFLSKLFPKLSVSHLKKYFEVTHHPHFFSCVTCIYLLFAFFQPYNVRANSLD